MILRIYGCVINIQNANVIRLFVAFSKMHVDIHKETSFYMKQYIYVVKDTFINTKKWTKEEK